MCWDKLESYNVHYTIPAETDRSAMPIGNGELCASVWMTEDGTLRFYLARTDSLSENDRTLKLGMVELKMTPAFLSEGGFSQTLLLKEGQIDIKSALGSIRVFVSSLSDTVYVTGSFRREMTVSANYYCWRTAPKTDASSPWINGATENADEVEYTQDGICFYHINGDNGIEALAKLQCISRIEELPDFLTDRIFGGAMTLSGGNLQGQALVSVGKEMCLKVSTHSGQYKALSRWKQTLFSITDTDPVKAMTETSLFWRAFWDKSYVFVSGDKPTAPKITQDIKNRAKEPAECSDVPSQVTQAYLLTRFMIACCKDGNFPIFYNGFLFNLCPGNREHLNIQTFSGTYTSQPIGLPDLEINPDERSWSIEHLWQNLRLPYYTLLASGDYSSVKLMFRYYLRFKGVNRQRARAFYGADGQHNTEMTLSCGLQSAGIYGTDRKDIPDGRCANQWGGSIEISPGLELLNFMLDYCDYSEDYVFLHSEVTEYAEDLMRYICSRFTERENGRIVISPLNSIETYFETKNPIPVVAGMHAVLRRLINARIDEEKREYFSSVLSITPPIPTGVKNGQEILLPAETYDEKRMNVETPELYTVYPFALYAACKENDTLARHSYEVLTARNELMQPHTIGIAPGAPSYSGWQYIGNTAAMLGLREQAGEILRNNSALKNPGNRFPAMWGPVYDAVPDSDHGANIINTLNLMLMQCYDRKIYLLPALPLEWNVHFKLFAPFNTTVECVYTDGKIKSVTVEPRERAEDIIIWGINE